jgi:hypothetical protein
MATGAEVLGMLVPTGGWVISGDEFESIRYDAGVEPITKKQFTDGFAKYDAYKEKQDQAKIKAKEAAQAKLAVLGLTVEDLSALGF